MALMRQIGGIPKDMTHVDSPSEESGTLKTAIWANIGYCLNSTSLATSN